MEANLPEFSVQLMRVQQFLYRQGSPDDVYVWFLHPCNSLWTFVHCCLPRAWPSDLCLSHNAQLVSFSYRWLASRTNPGACLWGIVIVDPGLN